MLERLGELLTGINWSAVLMTAIWAGLVAFTLGVSFLLWTRWGYYHLTGKCILFSVLAHLLLGLFFSTAQVVDNVVVAFSDTDQSIRPLTIENVRIMNSPNVFLESSKDDGSADAGPVAEWDRPGQGVELDPAAIDRAAPAVPEVAPAERPTREAQSLPRQSPRPELPVQSAVPDEPRLAKSDPEIAERVEQLATPTEPTAKAQEDQQENLPGDATRRAAPASIASEAVRNKPGPAPEVAPVRTDSTLKVPPIAAACGSAAEPNGPSPTVVSALRPGSGSSADDAPAGAGQPIATPDSAPASERPRPSGSAGSVGSAGSSGVLPSTSVRPGFASGPTRGNDPSAPARPARSSEDAAPIPNAKIGSGGALAAKPTSGSPGPSTSIRPFLPGKGAGGGTGSGREGMRLGTPEIYRDRMNPNRSETAVLRGGSKASEEAVERALAWLAAHQHQDGHWDADGFNVHCPAGDVCSGPALQNRDDCAVTGLVLLTFLGAGHTHRSGKYGLPVVNGLNWLLAQQKPSGDLRGTGKMYSQGIATLALSEAYGMTGDPKLRDPVERAAKFIVGAQNPTSGGWRYEPGQVGDTSILGWQLMALKSAALAGVQVPDSTWQKARLWLNTVGSGRNRGLASYLPGEKPSEAMTAEALMCRLFMGMSNEDAVAREAADYLMDYLPQPGRQNLYYWYYGTVASFQMGGDYWKRWNASLRDQLIAKQERAGHATGSWEPSSDPWGLEGGRIYATALATLSLEVYYRFLPLQSLNSKGP